MPRGSERDAAAQLHSSCSRNHPDDAQINPFFLSMLGHIARAAAKRRFDLLVSFQQLSDDWHTDYELWNRADG